MTDRHINYPDRPDSIGDLMKRPRPAPLPGPLPSTAPQRPRQLLDDRNWGLVNPDDIVQDYLSKQLLKMPEYGPDGRERSQRSVMERYYDRQNHSRTSAQNSREESFSPGNLFGDNSARGGISGLNGLSSVNNLNEFSNPNLNNGGIRPEALSDLLGLRNNPMSPDAIREREANERQMDAFKRALDFAPASPKPQTTAITPSSSGSSAWNGGSGNFNPAMPRSPFDPVAGTYNGALATMAPAAPLAPIAPTAPGQQSLHSTLPSYNSARSSTPKVDFALPQRRF